MNRRKFIQYFSAGAATMIVGGRVANELFDNPYIGNKGLIDQIENSVHEPYDVLTYEKIEEIVNDLAFNNESSIVFGQGCKTNGFVMRSDIDPNICDDPLCVSCREIEQAIKDSASKYLNKS